MMQIKVEYKKHDTLRHYDVMQGCERWEVRLHRHGLVALVDVMPRICPIGQTCDHAVVQAARVSYGQGTKTVGEDQGLIRYLMRHRHTTPSEMCLHGDTRIPTMPSRHATQKFYTIRELAEAFARGGKENSWVRLVKIRTVTADGRVVATRIRRAWKTGTRPVFRVTEDSALRRSVVVTDNHPFLTPGGYRPLADLKVGDEVVLNGNAVLEDTDIKEMWEDGLSLEEIGAAIVASRTTTFRRLRRAGVCTDRRAGWVRKEDRTASAGRHQATKMTPAGPCEVCGCPFASDVHHRDKNPTNNAAANRLRVCRPCHKALDGQSVQHKVYARRIASIESVSVAEVFDLEVESDTHNFVAEGFVVHNCEFKFHCVMPIFVARQWIRHRTANVNEYSARYSEVPERFYAPPPSSVRAQSQKNRQGGDQQVAPEVLDSFLSGLAQTEASSYGRYQEAIDGGIARELARLGLPLSTYTEWYWKIDLHNLLHFLSLRLDEHAQQEIREYAQAMFALIEPLVPECARAFRDYRLDGMSLSRLEVEALASGQPLASDNKREQEEYHKKLKRLGKA